MVEALKSAPPLLWNFRQLELLGGEFGRIGTAAGDGGPKHDAVFARGTVGGGEWALILPDPGGLQRSSTVSCNAVLPHPST